jgi:hypothetical protein
MDSLSLQALCREPRPTQATRANCSGSLVWGELCWGRQRAHHPNGRLAKTCDRGMGRKRFVQDFHVLHGRRAGTPSNSSSKRRGTQRAATQSFRCRR